MKGNKVDLAVPGPEGDWIQAALLSSEVTVRRCEVEDLTSGIPAPIVIVACGEGVKEALDALSVANQPVVILLGWTEDDSLENTTLFLERPVSISNLVRTVEQYLGPTSHVTLSRSERTINLPEEQRANLNQTMQLEVEAPAEGTAVRRADRNAPEHTPIARSKEQTEDSLSKHHPTHTDERVQLSEKFTALLLKADREIFSIERSEDWTFSKATKDAFELVPDSLLSSVSLPSDPQREDPLEVFTYLAPAATIASLNSATFVSDQPELSFRETARDVASVDSKTNEFRQPQPSPQQSGVISTTLSMLELLWTMHERTEQSLVTLEGDLGHGKAETIELGVYQGRVCAFACSLWSRALKIASESSALPIDARAANEAVAESRLRRAVAAGDIDAFTSDRAERLSRHQVLADLIRVAHPIGYTLRTPNQAELGKWLPVSKADFLQGSLVQAARLACRETDTDAVRSALGDSASEITAGNTHLHRVLTIAPKLYRSATAASIPSEIIRLIERHEGRALDSLIDMADSYVGLSASLMLLAGARAIGSRPSQLTDVALDFQLSAPAVQRRLLTLHSLAIESDYFSLLGISPTADQAMVQEGYHKRQAELSVPLGKLGLESLSDIRSETIDAVEDAYSLLKVGSYRSAYAASLRSI